MAGAATALLLGVRNTLYGLKLAPLLGWTGWRRVASAHWVIDESTAMSVMRKSRTDARLGFLVTGGSVFVLWNFFTFVGALAGEAMGDPKTYGLDAAVAGAFLALLWPRLASGSNRLVAALGAAVALGLTPGTRPGIPVLAAASIAVLVGIFRAKPDPTEIPGRRGPPRRCVVIWTAVIATAAGAYLLKLLGVSVPASVLAKPVVDRIADLLPVALLSALIAVQAFADGNDLSLDARAVGLGAAVVALLATGSVHRRGGRGRRDGSPRPRALSPARPAGRSVGMRRKAHPRRVVRPYRRALRGDSVRNHKPKSSDRGSPCSSTNKTSRA